MDPLTVVVALIMLVGLVGIVLPVLPGLLVVWAAVLLWSTQTPGTRGWVVLGIATILALTGFLLQYLLPGRRMREAGVRTSSIVAGAALGVVGFFVIPLVGAFVGFALGIYLVKRSRLGSHADAWQSTRQGLKAIALSIGIELVTAMTIAGTWAMAVATAP